MSETLLQTKLTVPPLRPKLVPRPHLVKRFNQGLQQGNKLTLISAPAGFGKTTLVSSWLEQVEMPIAWISLDERDNDLTRFLAYFIAALERAQIGLGESSLKLHQSRQSPSFEVILTDLINEVAGALVSLVMVLDDYQAITDHSIHEAVVFFIDHLPSQMHLIISSRTDPPWPLARMRSRDQLTELRAPDLRFAPDEASNFLNEIMGLALSADDIKVIESRTEGWIAGLQMAALSMRGRKDKSRYIRSFTGSNRFILDYLVEETLNQQPAEIQEFLLKTSILRRFNAALCDTVTGGDESQRILTQLESANLFLIPLDDDRRWYRYHHLFADLLQNYLQQTHPDLVPILHQRAGEWYESKGLIAEAVSHILAAGDVDRMTGLVEGKALALMDRGDLTTLVRWLEALPDETVRSRPWLCIAYAWVLAYSGQVDAVEPMLLDAERTMKDGSRSGAKSDKAIVTSVNDTALNHVEGRRLAAHITTIRAYVAAVNGNMSQAAILASEAMKHLSADDLMARGVAAALLAAELQWRGRLTAAAEAYADAFTISRAAGNNHVAITVLCSLAALQTAQGQLRRAAGTCHDALRLAEEYSGPGPLILPVMGLAYTRLSIVLCEWNDLGEALRYAREGLELCKQWGQADILMTGYLNMARVLQAMGDADGALMAIQDARQVASRDIFPYRVQVEALEAKLQLAQGNIMAASRWADDRGLNAEDEFDFASCHEYMILARLLIAQSRQQSPGLPFDKVSGLLGRILKILEDAEAVTEVIEVLLLQALLFQEQGKGDLALGALERALTLAEPEWFVRHFIDEGPSMAELLRQAAKQGVSVAYVGKLLAASAQDTRDDKLMLETLSMGVVEPLSKRELEVLRLLATHLPSADIAEELTISSNTVRFHIKNIYSKLNVHRRADAVQRAKELGWLT